MAYRDDRPLPDDHYTARPDRSARQVESDPLAELARLIGQTDPLSGFARSSQHPQPAQDFHQDGRGYEPDDQDAPPPPPSWLRSGGQDWRDEQSAAPQQRGPRFDAPEPLRADQARYDDVLYGQPQNDSGPPYDLPPAQQSYDGQDYAEQEDQAPRRRGGMLTVAIVLVLAVVGTAGAFAYRSLMGGGPRGEPPVIRADNQPSKIMPPAPSRDISGKPIVDRVGAPEQVVSREEQPVDVNARNARVVFPPLSQPNTPPTAQKAALPAVAPAASIPGAGEEPKRIRTVTIRPDQPSDTPPAVRPGAAPPAQARAAAPAPMQIAPQAQQTQQPARVSSVPQSIVPQTSSGGAGAYVVQVASQRSEGDAQASFRALQTRFPNVLGSRAAMIRRADLGDKGVVYRAMVGPFGSQGEAIQLCDSLKSVGGSCVVQRN